MRDIADFPQPPLVRGKSAMSRIAYVNGRYLPYAKAAVHAEDRGFQFADAVYEVIAVNEGRMVDAEGHMDRLERSLDELRILRAEERRVGKERVSTVRSRGSRYHEKKKKT